MWMSIPEGMESFEEKYSLYVTSTRPVSLRLERDNPVPAHLRLVRTAAEGLGYGETPLLRRLYAEIPESVENDIKRVVRRELDVRGVEQDTEPVSDDQSNIYSGTCTVEADEDFGGFRYRIRYVSDYLVDV